MLFAGLLKSENSPILYFLGEQKLSLRGEI